MPTDAELPEGYRIFESCPGGQDCPEPSSPQASVAADTEAEDPTGDPLTVDGMTVGVTQYSSPSEAERVLASQESDFEEYDGEFDVPVKENPNGGYSPGERGRGHLEDYTVDDWSGYQLVKTLTYIHRSGQSRVGSHTRAVLLRGSTVINAQIFDEAMPLDELVEIVIDRLA